ncbi:phosphonate metabolism transcriptional regulator PhnF [Pectobacterium carotovorum subsp. carotovorum]|nr:phosphonate metabolism transcriptional regulator PhnF [Pectobacterium carotovorum subsp. carotovorum]
MNIGYFIRENFRLNEENDNAMYIQLAAFIRHQIRLGIFKKNDRMATENELCEILGISRTTVRQAMNVLLEEGLLVRQRGRGSFIAERKINRALNSLYNFTSSMHEQNIEPRSDVISSTVCEASDEIAGLLLLPADQRRVFRLERVRYGDGSPLLHEITYVTYNLCPGIEEHNFSVSSLYEILKSRYGLNIFHATETIEAIIIGTEAADNLQCIPATTPGYRITRISSLENNFVFEYTTSITRADKCTFRVDMYATGQSAGRPSLGFTRNLKG